MKTKYTSFLIIILALFSISILPSISKAFASTTYNPTKLVEGFDVRVSDTELKNVKISWNIYRISGFDGYDVLRSESDDPQFPEDVIEKITSNTKRDTYDYNADLGKTYYYRVCAEAGADIFCSQKTAKMIMSKESEKGKIEYGLVKDFEAFRLEGKKTSQNYVELSWKKIKSSGFQMYTIMKSTTNTDMIYPRDKALDISIDYSDRTYIDTEAPKSGAVYYRVCMPTITDTLCSRTIEFNTETGKFVYLKKNKAIKDEDSIKTSTEEKIKASETTNNEKNLATKDENENEQDLLKEEVNETTSSEQSEDNAPKINDFSDISSHAYNKAIEYLINNKIVKGYKNGDKIEYRPKKNINRAEFIKILIETKYSSEYAESEKRNDCFTDLDEKNPQWFANYMCFAKEKNIIGGYADGSVKAGNNINFVEAAKILVNTYELPTSPEDNQPWYVPFVKALQQKNYIPPSINVESKLINRAELAELIWRIQEKVEGKSGKTFNFKKEKEIKPLKTSPEIEGPDQENIRATFKTDEYAEWSRFKHKEFTLMYPNEWYVGRKWDRNVFSEDEEYIKSLNTGESYAPYMYMMIYPLFISERIGADAALNIENNFGHKLVSSKLLEINGIKALRREYNAPQGASVNGRVTAVEENIIQYTFRFKGTVYVLQYFEAAKIDRYLVDTFDKIANSFLIK